MEAKMSATKDLSITRRSIMAAAALGGLSLVVPHAAIAAESRADVIEFSAFPEMSETEIDAIAHRHAEEEAARIIQAAMASDDAESRATRGRPSYSTVYGAVLTKASGWHDVAGQGPGGVHIDGGGDIHVQPSGGGSVSVSVPLPNGVGSIGVSIPLAKRGMSVTGYSVHIDGNGFWKATANIENKVQPFVVYETIDGVKKVYKKAASNTFFRMSLSKRKVG
ncbi:hypothetical protein [Collinsella intestinalis]|nr:hypothetical protein [Collinsella intestinalis]